MLSTCKILQCEDIPHCKLKDGFMDLCQKPAQFLAEIKLKTGQIWEQKQIVQSVIFAKIQTNQSGEKIEFLTLTPNGISVPFEIDPVRQTSKSDNQPPLNIALARISRLRAAKTVKAKKQTTRQKMISDFMEKQGFTPVELKPELKPEPWIPEMENHYERCIIQGLTDIEDRCIYRPVDVDEERPALYVPDVTKKDQEMKDRRSWEKWILKYHDDRDTKLRNLQNMGY